MTGVYSDVLNSSISNPSFNKKKIVQGPAKFANTVKPLYIVFQGTERFKRYREVNVIRRSAFKP